jgi:hypothetical protein
MAITQERMTALLSTAKHFKDRLDNCLKIAHTAQAQGPQAFDAAMAMLLEETPSYKALEIFFQETAHFKRFGKVNDRKREWQRQQKMMRQNMADNHHDPIPDIEDMMPQATRAEELHSEEQTHEATSPYKPVQIELPKADDFVGAQIANSTPKEGQDFLDSLL